MRSIQQCRGLRCSSKDRTFKVNKLFIIWPFAWLLQARNRPVPALRENNALVLANQSLVILAKNASHIVKVIKFLLAPHPKKLREIKTSEKSI